MTTPILIIQTGGTIDKDYPKTIRGYSFEINDASSKRILQRGKVCSEQTKFVTVCQKDSQKVNEEDRIAIAELCRTSNSSKVLITHGTDTMIETAVFLARQNLQKTVVITGAFLPETFKNSDADFNVGFSLGALNCLESKEVFIAMNGNVIHWSKCVRDPLTNMFSSLEKDDDKST